MKIKDFFYFFQKLPYSYSTEKEENKDNTILILENQISIFSIREPRNTIIEIKNKKENLLVLKIINRNSIDRFGLRFEKTGKNIYIVVIPYFISENYKVKLINNEKDTILFGIYKIFKNFELSTVIKPPTVSIIFENKTEHVDICFRIISFD
ncbi:MAG TPA: hypothetical protein PKW55_07640 [Spirochaetota bacterium]|nr:hypothetical protein [Spirochaetota bacterium]HOM38657.1 hypothetical protein [Spirochaetota bacterium]HPQ49827.1 hypothetical protein [Spirochaetota bacterium]